MNIEEHFKQTDAVYLNLDSAVDRRNRFESLFNDKFKTLIRKRPISFNDEIERGWEVKYAAMHKDDPLHIADKEDIYQKVSESSFKNRKPLTSKRNARTWLPRHYAAMQSETDTMEEILEDFLDSNESRLIVVEDDAIARDIWQVEIPEKILAADIIIWGGAVCSIKDDTNLFKNSDGFRFKKLSSKTISWFSTCYEVNKVGAEELLRSWNGDGTQLDLFWRYAFDRCNAYAMTPMGFAQVGLSKTGYDMHMPKTKEEAVNWKKYR